MIYQFFICYFTIQIFVLLWIQLLDSTQNERECNGEAVFELI